MTTETIARPEVCPDPFEHDRLYAQRETTWRLTAAQRAAEQAHGCGWCGGRRPS